MNLPDEYIPLQDKLRINQIVFNILSNAVKFTPEGGTIRYTANGKMMLDGGMLMHIEISDTGIGMSDEFQKAIFDPFVQENRDDNSDNRGTGLGMAITKRLVDLMFGTISVKSKLGQGTTFIIDIPFRVIPADEIAEQSVLENTEHNTDHSILSGKHACLQRAIRAAQIYGQRVYRV